MKPIDRFLQEVEQRNADLDARVLQETLAEIRDHLEHATADLRVQGWSSEAAELHAIRGFGSATVVRPAEIVWFKHRSFWLPLLFLVGLFGCVTPGLFAWVPYWFYQTQIPTVFGLLTFVVAMGGAGFWGGRRWAIRVAMGLCTGLACGILLLACTSSYVPGIGDSVYIGGTAELSRARKEASEGLQRLESIEQLARERRGLKGPVFAPHEGSSYRANDIFICRTDKGSLVLRAATDSSLADRQWEAFSARKSIILADYKAFLIRLHTAETQPVTRALGFLKNLRPDFFLRLLIPSFVVSILGRLLALFIDSRRTRRRGKAIA